MELTEKQIEYLARYADKCIAHEEAEAVRVAETEAAREKEEARTAEIARLKEEKEAELKAAIEKYDSDNGIEKNAEDTPPSLQT